MGATKLDIRKLNKWLEANIPFRAKAWRKPHREVVIGAEAGKDLTIYADAIRDQFAGSITRMDIGGLTNYITLIAH